MYGCESWTIKKAECLRIDAFKLWCWRRLLRVPWTMSPKGNKVWIHIGRTDAKAPIVWPPDVKIWLTGKDPDIGKDWGQEEKGAAEDNRGWDGWMTSLNQQTWVWANSGRWWWTGEPGLLQSMVLQRVGHNWVTEQQQQKILEPFKIGKYLSCFPGLIFCKINILSSFSHCWHYLN